MNGYPDETNAPYGIAKKALLVQCQAYRRQYGMSAIFLLPVNLYGPGDNFEVQTSHVITLVATQLPGSSQGQSGGNCTVGGRQSHARISLREGCRAGIVAATRLYDKPAPVNLGSGHEIFISELAATDRTTSGLYRTYLVGYGQTERRRCLDTRKPAEEFGFRASTSLRTGLQKTVAWYRGSFSTVRPGRNLIFYQWGYGTGALFREVMQLTGKVLGNE